MRLTTWLSVLLISFQVAIIFGVSSIQPVTRCPCGATFRVTPFGGFIDHLPRVSWGAGTRFTHQGSSSLSTFAWWSFCEDAPLPVTYQSPVTVVVTCVVVLDGGLVFFRLAGCQCRTQCILVVGWLKLSPSSSSESSLKSANCFRDCLSSACKTVSAQRKALFDSSSIQTTSPPLLRYRRLRSRHWHILLYHRYLPVTFCSQ